MRLCLFTVGGARCALPIESVREIVRVPETTPVPPGTPVVALAALRGRIVSIVDRSADLGSACNGEWLLLLETEGRDVGLRIDALPSIGDVEAALSAAPPHLDARTAMLLTGVLLLDEPVHLLDPIGLVGQ